MTQGLSVGVPPTTSEQDRSQAAIAQLLDQAQCELDASVDRRGQLLSELAQSLELTTFALGDELYGSGDPDDALLLLIEGRARILCPNSQDSQRQFSIQVIESGSSFAGPRFTDPRFADPRFADPRFADPQREQSWRAPYRPYRVVAASAGQLARIRSDVLATWLQRLPRLGSWLQQSAQLRDDLIFLRTEALGQVRSLPSYQLQGLRSLLVPVEVKAGERLAGVAALRDSYCWLRRGQVQSPRAPGPQPGDSWGYPDPTPQPWVAKTTVLLYVLPRDRWAEAVSLGLSSLPFAQSRAAQNSTASGSSSTADQRAESSPGGPLGLNHLLSRRGRPTAGVIPQRLQPNQSHLPSGGEAAAVAASRRGDSAGSSGSRAEGDRANAGPRSAANVEFPTPPRRLRLRLWNRYPFIAQQSAADCGPTCLAMIAQFWGQRLNVNILREIAQVGRSGSTLKNLGAAAERVGFGARPVRASFSRMADQKMPWIAHWQGDHYIVVYRVKGDRVLLSDPARGKRQISKQNFLRNWTGYALLLEPTDRLNRSEAAQKASLSRFWKVLWPYRNILWQVVGLSLLLQVFGLVSPILTQVILDQVVVQKSVTTLNVFVIGAFMFGVWGIVLGAVRQYLLDYFSNRLNLTLVSGFINHTLRLPISFFENRQVGDILTRVRENQKIQAFLMRQAISTWLDASMAVIYMVLMFYYNAQLAWLVVGMLPPIVILTLASTPFLKQLSREVFNKSAEQSSLLVEMLTGISTVKASAAEQEIRWRWEERLTELLNIQFRAQKLTNGLQVMSGLINSTGSLLLLWYGAKLVIGDQLTIGQLVAFNMLIGKVIGPVLSLVGLWDEFQEVTIAVERLNDVLEHHPEDDTGKPLLVMPPIQGEVRFENVTFRYSEGDEQNILQNISFRAQPGETIALVGRSGSGKTTLIKLLQGMYAPSSGRISIDGHDITHVAPASLRIQMGVVPQESFLFSGSILDNIKIYREDYSLEEVVEVAKLAEAHSFIQDLPMGYSTNVGERGSNLSGGQRQRVAIARALLGDPAILLLDEATSALDTESERRFQQNLTHISHGRTTFIIAHRLSTVRSADRILVLDRGVIAEQGNHETLVEQRGLYYHLAQQQLEL